MTYSIDSSNGTLNNTGTVVDGWGPVALTLTPGNTPVTRTPKFAYVVGSNVASTYAIDAASGALTFKGSVATGTGPFSVATDPSIRFAYVANGDRKSVV